MVVHMVGSSVGALVAVVACLLVVWTARDVEAGGPGSLHIVGSGDAQIQIWKLVLIVVGLSATWWQG